VIDRRPADDANWDGLPGTSRRRLISSLLLALALAAGIALAIYGGLTGPTDSHPAPNAQLVVPLAAPNPLTPLGLGH